MEDIDPWFVVTSPRVSKKASHMPQLFTKTPRLFNISHKTPQYSSPYSKLEPLNKSSFIPTSRRQTTQTPNSFRVASKPTSASKSRSNKKSVDLDRAVIEMLQSEVERAWDFARLSDHFKELYRALLFSLPPNICSAEIAKQVQEFNSGSSPVLLALKAIKTREHSLQGLKELDSSLLGANLKSQYMLLECAEMLHAFRLLSLMVLEAVVTWRQHIYAIQQTVLKAYLLGRTSALPFVWEETNYLLKMKSDTEWFRTSNLKKYFDFDEGFDPFMVRCSAAAQLGNKNKTGIVLEGNAALLPMSRKLLRRIMDAELLLAEEPVVDSIKPPNFSMLYGSVSASASILVSPTKTDYQDSERQHLHSRRHTAIGGRRKKSQFPEHRHGETRGIQEMISDLLGQEVFEDILERLVEQTVYASLRSQENEALAEVLQIEILEAEQIALMQRVAEASATEVISETLLRDVLGDLTYLQEIVLQQVKETEDALRREADEKLKQMKESMEKDLANTLWQAVVETCVQFEIYTSVNEELATCRAYVNDAAITAVQGDLIEVAFVSLIESFAEGELTSAKQLLQNEQHATEAIRQTVFEDLLNKLETDLRDLVEVEIASAKANQLKQYNLTIDFKAAEALATDVLESWLKMAQLPELAKSLLDQAKFEANELHSLACELLLNLVEEAIHLERLDHFAMSVIESKAQQAEPLSKVSKQSSASQPHDHMLAKQPHKDNAVTDALIVKPQRPQDLLKSIRPSSSSKRLEADEVLSTAVLQSVIDSFIELPWLTSVAEVQLHEEQRQAEIRVQYADPVISIEVPDEYVHIAFTPGIHSPNVYSMASLSLISLSAASDQDEEPVYAFVGASDTKGAAKVSLAHIGTEVEFIHKVVKNYYAQLRDPVVSTVLTYNELREAEERLEVPCWYWLLVNGRIGGVVLFSLDRAGSGGRCLEVQHFSTIYLAHYNACLKHLCGWIWHADPCDVVKVRLYSNHGVPSEINRSFIQLDFNCTTYQDGVFSRYTQHLMELDRPSGLELVDDSFLSAMHDIDN